MTDIIEKAFRAGDLPPSLRGDMEADAPVLVSVQRLTINGFTETFDGVLAAARAAERRPFRPAADVIKELKARV